MSFPNCFTPISITGISQYIDEDIIEKYPESKHKEHAYYIVEHHMSLEGLFTSIHMKKDITETKSERRVKKETEAYTNKEDFDGSFGIDYNGDFGNLPICPYAWPHVKEQVNKNSIHLN